MANLTTRLVLLQHTDRQPRGAWFEITHREALTTAAIHPQHALVEIDAAKLKAIAPDLTAGKLGSNGIPDPLPVMLAASFQRLLELAKVGTLVSAAAASIVPPPIDVPAPWSNLVVGSTVLASDAQDDGWWECVVIALEGNNMLRLRWRDFPGFNHFSRPVTRVGLLPPGGAR